MFGESGGGNGTEELVRESPLYCALEGLSRTVCSGILSLWAKAPYRMDMSDVDHLS